MKLKYQWPIVWSLLLLVPLRDTVALSATDNTLLQHMLWPLVHANILHWLINTICFMGMWRLVTTSRIVCGYVASVAIGYLWVYCVSLALLPLSDCQLKLCGMSCIIFFLIGSILLRASKWYRIRLTVLVVISCFIPGIAASVHILALFAGFLYSYLARIIGTHTKPINLISYD